MKTYKHLYEQFISEENFKLAWREAIKHKLRRSEVKNFTEKDLIKLRNSVIDGSYTVSEYKEKMVYEPKKRIIYILPLKDRIVHHAVIQILKPIFLAKFDYHSYACVEGKGQQAAVKTAANYVRTSKYALKCDISKFFPSINHDIMFGMFQRIIKDNKFLEILHKIIYSIKGETNLPIGNYTSQWFGNFYLTELDNFIRHNLKCSKYVRYCDDFILFSNDKVYLQDCKKRIEFFINLKLKLKYSRKDVFNTKQGIDFCGYRIFGKYILLRKSTSKRIKKKMKYIVFGKKTLNRLGSYIGWLKHCCSYNLKENLGLLRAFQIAKLMLEFKERGKEYDAKKIRGSEEQSFTESSLLCG